MHMTSYAGDLTMTDIKGTLTSSKDADAANPLLDIKSTSTKCVHCLQIYK